MTIRAAATAALAFLVASAAAQGRHTAAPKPPRLSDGNTAWRDSGLGGIRGFTIGPIESALHPGKGYGTEASARTMTEAKRLGANWVSLTPFGRVWDLAPSGIDLTFEKPYLENERALSRAVEQAHRAGLRVLVVPHLWVENGDWRGQIDPGDDAGWKKWAVDYRRFVLEWAKVAEASHVDMLSIGVELRSFATTTRAPLLTDVIHDVKGVYDGLLTYGANWDDVMDTVVLGELDVIGLNAFFPLSKNYGASFDELADGGRQIRDRLRSLSLSWNKPVMFTEIGYTTRKDVTVEPWKWPDGMKDVVIDERAQAEGYAALLAPLLDEPWFAGCFVWRIYSDPDDMSQEARWGFSPRGKLAELVVRDAFAARWEADGVDASRSGFFTPRATGVGSF
jgi:hypothetical protein